MGKNNKYTGIRLISNSNSTKARDSGKIQEDQMFLGTIGGSSKPIAYMNGIIGKQSFGPRVERGYETLREKKVGEKMQLE